MTHTAVSYVKGNIIIEYNSPSLLDGGAMHRFGAGNGKFHFFLHGTLTTNLHYWGYAPHCYCTAKQVIPPAIEKGSREPVFSVCLQFIPTYLFASRSL